MWGAYEHQGRYYIIHKESMEAQGKPVYYFPMSPYSPNERLADQVAEYMNKYVPLNKAKPTKKEIEKAGDIRRSFVPVTFFASGLEANASLTAMVDKGFQVGISAKGGKINKDFFKRVLALSVNPKTMLFFDSGAFSEIDKNGNIVKPIDWNKVIGLYFQAVNAYGDRLYIVAPDRIGDQKESLRRLEAYLDRLQVFRNVIIPLQSNAFGKGKGLSLKQMYDKINTIVKGSGLQYRWIPAIPVTQKSPYDLKDVLEFVKDVEPKRLHILGASPANPQFEMLTQTLPDLNPFLDISIDAQRISAMVGYKDKAKERPRTLTELEQFYRTQKGQKEWEEYINYLYQEDPDRFDMTEMWSNVEGIFGNFNRKTRRWESNPLYYAFLAELYTRIPEELPSYKPWLAASPTNFELLLHSDPYLSTEDLYPYMSPENAQKIEDGDISQNSMEYWDIIGEVWSNYQPNTSGSYWGEFLDTGLNYTRDENGELRIERNLLEKAYILSLFLKDNEKERRILQQTFQPTVRYSALMDVPAERIGRRETVANPRQRR